MSPPAHRVDSLRGRDCSRRSEALPMLTAEKRRPYMHDVVQVNATWSAMFNFTRSKIMMLKLPVGTSKKMSNIDIMTSMATLG